MKLFFITCVIDFYGGINKLISMLHILISGQHWNNRVTESDEELNEIRYTY